MSISHNIDSNQFNRQAIVHFNSAYKNALRLTKSRMDAEDLVQDTYFRAYRFFGKFKDGSNCKAWLLKIMSNLYINEYNRNKFKNNHLAHYNIEDYHSDCTFTKSDYIENRHYDVNNFYDEFIDDDIKKILLDLPANFRLIIILSDIQGFSYSDIAEMFNLKLGTVKSRLFRARKKISKKLYEYGVSHGYSLTRR